MHAMYHDKDSKTHWNDYLKQKKRLYDIHIHVLIKPLRGKTLKDSHKAAGLQLQYIEYVKTSGIHKINMLLFIHAKDYQNINMRREVLTIVGED